MFEKPGNVCLALHCAAHSLTVIPGLEGVTLQSAYGYGPCMETYTEPRYSPCMEAYTEPRYGPYMESYFESQNK
jgi:hypothetical protein